MKKSFIVGAESVMIHVDGPLLEGWEKCPDLKTLLAYGSYKVDMPTPTMEWKGAKIPAELLKQVLGTIQQFPKMEVAFSLYYSSAESKWAVKCPPQHGCGSSVYSEDNGTGMPEGYYKIGTIHTHPEMAAFWSGTDHNDQDKQYGVHFVLGLRNGFVHEYKATIFTPRGSYDKQWEDLAEAVDFNQTYEPVKEWVNTIEKQELKGVARKSNYQNVTCSGGSSKIPVSTGVQYKWANGYPYHRDNYQTWASTYRATRQPYISVIDDKLTAELRSQMIHSMAELRAMGRYDVIETAITSVINPLEYDDLDSDPSGAMAQGDEDTASALCDGLLAALEHVLYSLEHFAQFCNDSTLIADIEDILWSYGYNKFDSAQYGYQVEPKAIESAAEVSC